VEVPNAAKDFDEDFLSDVGGIARIGQDAIDEAVERLLIAGDEPGKRLLGSRFELLDDRSFFGMDTDHACKIPHGRTRLHPVAPFSVAGMLPILASESGTRHAGQRTGLLPEPGCLAHSIPIDTHPLGRVPGK
jgi:hypothetical protein